MVRLWGDTHPRNLCRHPHDSGGSERHGVDSSSARRQVAFLVLEAKKSESCDMDMWGARNGWRSHEAAALDGVVTVSTSHVLCGE